MNESEICCIGGSHKMKPDDKGVNLEISFLLNKICSVNDLCVVVVTDHNKNCLQWSLRVLKQNIK